MTTIPNRHYVSTDIPCPACRRSHMVTMIGADNTTMYLYCSSCYHTVRAVEYLALSLPVATQPSLFTEVPK